jgi:hypothetical protein
MTRQVPKTSAINVVDEHPTWLCVFFKINNLDKTKLIIGQIKQEAPFFTRQGFLEKFCSF